MDRNPPVVAYFLVAGNFFRRASGGITRPPCAALPAKLTLMSLKADADVMAVLTDQSTLTLMSYSTRGDCLRADRHRARML